MFIMRPFEFLSESVANNMMYSLILVKINGEACPAWVIRVGKYSDDDVYFSILHYGSEEEIFRVTKNTDALKERFWILSSPYQ